MRRYEKKKRTLSEGREGEIEIEKERDRVRADLEWDEFLDGFTRAAFRDGLEVFADENERYQHCGRVYRERKRESNRERQR
jgi:hypothetical protein